MRNDVAYVSFYMRSNTIRIFKSTIRAMGIPKFIRLRIHETEGTMIIEPYDRITFSSFRVPFPLNDSKEGMDIHSKRFIRIVAALMRWDMERTYRVSGELYGKLKIVKFDLVQAVKIFMGSRLRPT